MARREPSPTKAEYICADQPATLTFRLRNGGGPYICTGAHKFTRECVTLLADNTLSGEKVAAALDKVLLLRGAPESITVDNETEFTSKALDHWAYRMACI